MRQRHAVTCFLQWDNEILLLLRSQRVSTYPGKWAGISGSVDDDNTADEQALGEIREETGLGEGDVELVRKGKPLLFDDATLKVRKVVHPYLFRIRDRSKINIDWEHERIRWIKPEDIDNYDTMPLLKETLAQVLVSRSEDDRENATA